MFARTLRLAPTLLKTPFAHTLTTTSRMSAPYQVIATDSECPVSLLACSRLGNYLGVQVLFM